jgi:septation ring formation regulator EzrA
MDDMLKFLNANVQILRTTIERQYENLSASSIEQSRLNRTITTLRDANNVQNEHLKTLESDYNDLLKRYTIKENENALTSLTESKFSQLQTNFLDLKRQFNNQSAENVELKKEIQKWRKQNADCLAEVQTFTDREEEIEKRETELASQR